jgi:peptide/nickel transport system substrate-binding protein
VPASPGANTNASGFCDPSIDAKMERGDRGSGAGSGGGDHSVAAGREGAARPGPVRPTYTRSNVDLIAKRVGNYQYNPQWGVLLSQLWVK